MAWLRRPAMLLLDTLHSVLAREPNGAFLRARTLVFAPHQDDEVLGCGGTVLLKRDAGAAVRIVFMTDGASSHPGLIAPEELAALRRREALAAGGLLGLTPEDIVFLEFPDETLHQRTAEVTAAARALIEEFRPDEVFVPHLRDRLPDHVATFRAVRAALVAIGRPVRLLEYPVWLWNSWPWAVSAEGVHGRGWSRQLRDWWALAAGCRVRVDVREVVARKRGALEAHASQVSRPAGNTNWPVLGDVGGGQWLECFFTGHERFRESRPCD